MGLATPTDSGLMLYAAFPERPRLPEFKRDTEGALRAFVGSLPDAPPERLMFSAAVNDPRIADHVDAFAAHLMGPRRFLAPAAIARAVRANLGARPRGGGRRALA